MTRDSCDRARGGASSVVTRLSGRDHELCSLLSVHRVLTTSQLVSLTRRPERTIDYRLQRLRSQKLVDRTRPYVASGSAPFSWWLTRSGAHLVEGSSPAPGKATPNPLFLRHTTALAGLYVALTDVGASVTSTRTRPIPTGSQLPARRLARPMRRSGSARRGGNGTSSSPRRGALRPHRRCRPPPCRGG